MNMKSDYKDDPDYFGQSADSAQPGPGLNDPKDKATTSPTVAPSSADWKDGVGPLGDASPLASQRKDDAKDDAPLAPADEQHPPSRSADPGQSSYGGFKNEGPAESSSGSA